MATKIETGSFTTTTPASAGQMIRDAQFGIDATISGFIIQNITINSSRNADITYDQKGMEVSELDIDEAFDCSITVIGGSAEDGTVSGLTLGDTAFTFASKTWKVTGLTFNGTYNGKKSYTIQLHRSHAFPAGN